MKSFLTLLVFATLLAAQEGNTSGQFRTFYVDRDYAGIVETHRNALAYGGYLKHETAARDGVRLGIAFYTTQGAFTPPLQINGTDNPLLDASLFGPGNASMTYIGEAYVAYRNDAVSFKAGRQKLETPMAASDDARMLPNLFEAYMLSFKPNAQLVLQVGHLAKFAQGSFGRVYNALGTGASNAGVSSDALLSATSGYSLIDSRSHVGTFMDMGSYGVGAYNGGVSLIAATYKPSKTLALQAWDYYAYDLFHTIYAQGDAAFDDGALTPYISVQAISQADVGIHKAATLTNKLSTIESQFWGAKVGIKTASWDLSAAASIQSKNSAAALNGGTMTLWGGMSAFTQGMVTRHQFMAGTAAYKVAALYDFKPQGLDLKTACYYVTFAMDNLGGYSVAGTASETGFDIIHRPMAMKNLELRFRGNFPRNYKESSTGALDWDEYRLIANYNF